MLSLTWITYLLYFINCAILFCVLLQNMYLQETKTRAVLLRKLLSHSAYGKPLISQYMQRKSLIKTALCSFNLFCTSNLNYKPFSDGISILFVQEKLQNRNLICLSRYINLHQLRIISAAEIPALSADTDH